MPKVLIADRLSPAAADVFRDNGIEVDVSPGLAPAELKDRIDGYEGLAVRSATKVTADLLAAADNLKVIGRAGVGIDNIDVAAATARGVAVMNSPFGNATTTAEHTIALMMSLARQVPSADRSTRSGKWEKSRFLGVELTTKVLGIIGCGNIGSIVSNRAQGLKMRVVAYDPYLSKERAAEIGVEKLELGDLFARADFVSLHTPINDSTRGIIDAAAFARMKPGVRIINCARGGLVVEHDLKEAIESGQVAGAALDVFEAEPPQGNPLLELENVIVTPHLGAATGEAQENVALQIAQQMSDFLNIAAVTNAVNMPSVTAEEAPLLKPYMKLAAQLGGFAGQLTEASLVAVTVEYEGHAAELNTRALTAIVLEGLLSPLMASVNMVNAPHVAKQRNIDISEIKHDRAGDYHTLIRLTVTTERRRRGVAGTLLHGRKPWIVEIKGINIEAEIGPTMLYVNNQDKPGIIGGLGATLAEAGVNIATFHLGRASVGGEAIALLQVDAPLSHEVLEKVRAIDGVVQAKSLTF